MLLDPGTLEQTPSIVEEVERASLRFVVQALYDFRDEAVQIFRLSQDWVADVGEDITREALDGLGMPVIRQRLFGKMDYKKARYVFHPDYAIRQALFVDSKVEKDERSATLQLSQTSLEIRQVRQGQSLAIQGQLPAVLYIQGEAYLTTTIFVKYHYRQDEGMNQLLAIIVAALPNGLLQERYNPTAQDGIWLAGRNAPSRGEQFRVRLSFAKLKAKARWRVQRIPVLSSEPFKWEA